MDRNEQCVKWKRKCEATVIYERNADRCKMGGTTENAQTMQIGQLVTLRSDLVAVIELEAPFLADAAVKRHSLVKEAEFWRTRSG